MSDLTVICNSPGFGPLPPQMLAENGQVSKPDSSWGGGYASRTTPLSEQIGRGEVAFEIASQGTSVERIRAAAAFFTPAGAATVVAEGKERPTLD